MPEAEQRKLSGEKQLLTKPCSFLTTGLTAALRACYGLKS